MWMNVPYLYSSSLHMGTWHSKTFYTFISIIDYIAIFPTKCINYAQYIKIVLLVKIMNKL